MSTNFAKALVWKHEYDVNLWRHKQRTVNANDHHMPLNENSPWKFSAYAIEFVQKTALEMFMMGISERSEIGFTFRKYYCFPAHVISFHSVRVTSESYHRCQFTYVSLSQLLAPLVEFASSGVVSATFPASQTLLQTLPCGSTVNDFATGRLLSFQLFCQVINWYRYTLKACVYFIIAVSFFNNRCEFAFADNCCVRWELSNWFNHNVDNTRIILTEEYFKRRTFSAGLLDFQEPAFIISDKQDTPWVLQSSVDLKKYCCSYWLCFIISRLTSIFNQPLISILNCVKLQKEFHNRFFNGNCFTSLNSLKKNRDYFQLQQNCLYDV